jgi:hypothetical protein
MRQVTNLSRHNPWLLATLNAGYLRIWVSPRCRLDTLKVCSSYRQRQEWGPSDAGVNDHSPRAEAHGDIEEPEPILTCQHAP